MRTAIIVAVLTASVLAQRTQPTIVSSVKRSQSVDEGIKGANFLRGDTFQMANRPMTPVLMAAYGTPARRIIGAPDWVKQDRWDVEIKVQVVDGMPMRRTAGVVQAMLRDRFKLDAVMETRDRPVYALRRSRADGKLGPNLVPASFECQLGDIPQQEALRTSGVQGTQGQQPSATRAQFGVVSFAGLPIETLLPFIPADRVVVNETGIVGPVDLHLTWTHTGDSVSDQASLYSAIGDQLGLKLDASTARLDVLVIRSISRPTEN